MMGTFGTDLLGSDSALDFLDGIAALPESERASEVSRVLALAADDPSSIMRDIVPEEVIAAAVLVAATLPGAQDLSGNDDDVAANASLPEPASTHLAQLAVRAVDMVTGPDSWWRKSWAREGDLVAAEATIAGLRFVLQGGSE
jgi:alpha-glucosidase